MAIEIVIPADEIYTPQWEPSDCSVLENDDGRIQVFCHFSQRTIAYAESVEEANAFLLHVHLQSARVEIQKDPTSPLARTWPAPKIAPMVSRLKEMGFENLADENMLFS